MNCKFNIGFTNNAHRSLIKVTSFLYLYENKNFNFVIVRRIFKYVLVSLNLLLAYTSQAQQSSNPFEIIRTDKNSTDTVVAKTPKSDQKNSKNSFEVYRNDDPNASIPSTNTNQGSIKVENLGGTKDEESDEVDIDADDMDIMLDNPFEVSHVPYRRSELKEQAKSANTNSLSKKSYTRSIVHLKYSSNTFIFWLVLFTLLLLAIVINVQRNVISKIVKSITNENVLKLLKREENNGLSGHYIMLYVIFFINFTCFIYLMAKYYKGFDGFNNWLVIYGAVTVTYLLRHISMTFIGNIFNISKDSSLYSFTIMSFNIFLGLVLIPVNLVVAFSPVEISSATLQVGIGLIIILLLIRLARGLLVGARFISENLFQFFIYLCTFEIAPILILLKILGEQ